MESPKTLTAEETEKLLYELLYGYRGGNPTHKQIRNHTIALLMLDAGLRVGEVVQLRISDLYFNCQPVTSITIRPEIAKNKTERTIPVSQRLTEVLKNQFQPHEPHGEDWGNAFTFRQGNDWHHITTRQVERIIRQAAMKSLGRPIHPHVLRHTFASRLMRKTNVRVVQELLGHKHLTSTQVYTHPNGEDLKQAIDSIEAAAIHSAAGRAKATLTPGVPDQLNAPGTKRDVR